MSEKPLLLSSAKTGVLVTKQKSERVWLFIMAAIGLFVVLVGAVDVTSRVSRDLGKEITFDAFAPAIVLFNSTSTPAAPAVTSVATTSPIMPALLTIPSIGVKANVEQVGKKGDGSMGTPLNFEDVAWYSLGAKPGAAGNAVIDGHVNNALTKAGVFEHLSQIKLGDSISVADAAGNTVTYKVSDIEEYPASTAPAESIFATTGPSQLVLITCDGDWVPADKTFSMRLVVFAARQ